jgi:hypothetical protein
MKIQSAVRAADNAFMCGFALGAGLAAWIAW